MEENIQKIFSLIRNGDKNAALQLNIKLKTFMNPSADIGEITRMYRYFKIRKDDTEEELNSKIVMIIIENILLTDKLNKMSNWTELKWYSKRIAYILIQEHFQKQKIHNKMFVSYATDEEELRFNQNLGEIDVSVIDYEIEYAKLCEEIFSLISAKCRALFELLVKDLNSDEVLEKMRELGHTVQDSRNLASTKNKCKKNLKLKVSLSNKYSDWEAIFLNNNN